jgi:hypothetical protein
MKRSNEYEVKNILKPKIARGKFTRKNIARHQRDRLEVANKTRIST